MSRDRIEQDELDYDTQQGQWAPSIFDDAEPVEDLEPEKHSLDGHYEKKRGEINMEKKKIKLFMHAIPGGYDRGFTIDIGEVGNMEKQGWLYLGQVEIDVPMSDDDIRAHFASKAKAAAIAKLAAAQAELEALNGIL